MRHFHFSCQGESHKATNKPCQDASCSLVEDDLCVAVVCDGHGGERYFRSDVGARFCTAITVQAVKDFVACIDRSLLKGKPFTQERAIAEKDDNDKLNATDKAFRQLFASIITAWNVEIEQYTDQHPLTEEERQKLAPKYVTEFEQRKDLEKFYGCTLMAYVQTKDYWFAFHLGDGKCVSFHKELTLWKEPIPWDDRCFLNKTTSICDSDALNELRYCYQGDGKFPVAVFLGSDGMDDSFGPMENLVDFYMQVAKLLAADNQDAAHQEIEATLPELSRRGSQDDMSIAYIYDEASLSKVVQRMVKYQIRQIESAISDAQAKADDLRKSIAIFSDSTDEKGKINFDYAQKDLQKVLKTIERLTAKLKQRQTELKEAMEATFHNKKPKVQTLYDKRKQGQVKRK